MRAAGILLPISSLPTKYGIGGFSREAYEFVDQLEKAGQKYWQILPLGPTGYGDSPYQSFSTFAGNPYYISLETLTEEGLLTEEECKAADSTGNPAYVEYERVYNTRFRVLRKAFERFIRLEELPKDYIRFREENKDWLEDYCLYRVLKSRFGGKCWNEWPKDEMRRDPEVLERERKNFAGEIGFFSFMQYEFRKQWSALKTYANEKGIQIIGDIPIYVAMDSSDAWANPELFQFDKDYVPVAVAGCPPDSFAADGQLWGNPLYDWAYHKRTGYAWWIRRMQYCRELYDVIRIDHFRGFESYYSIPYGSENARHGHWEKGPGLELFEAAEKKLGACRFIAEDLGYLTDEVIQMVKASGYPGMKVLEFAFDSGPSCEYLPHSYDKNCVVYTGTHDNDTVIGWYDSIDDAARTFLEKYMGHPFTGSWDLVRMALASTADLAVIPVQDYLGLGTAARVNFPSTLGTNWKWRLLPDEITDGLCERIRNICAIYDRLPDGN